MVLPQYGFNVTPGSGFDELQSTDQNPSGGMQIPSPDLSGFHAFTNSMAATARDNADPPIKITTVTGGPDGEDRAVAEGTQRQLTEAANALKELQAIKASYASEYSRLDQQQSASRGVPNILANIAGNLAANDPRMPGWVQALGRSSLALNPTEDTIRQRKMQVMGKQANLTEKEVGLMTAQQRAMQMRENQQITQQNQRDAIQQKKVAAFLTNIGKDERSMNEPMSQEAFVNKAALSGIPEDQAQGLFDGHVERVQQHMAQLQEKQALKDQGTTLQNQLKSQSDMALAVLKGSQAMNRLALSSSAKNAQDAEVNEAMDTMAKSIANRELTAIRGVTSLRGNQRLLIFNRARKIDPTVTASEIDRMIKMQDSVDNGPIGVSMRSLGTFLEHTGELADTAKKVSLTNSALLNKPMNWWRDNMATAPEYQKLKTAIEPVAKEYMTFLLNNRALYKDDREAMDALINSNLPLAKVLAATNQAGKTALDRFNEMNHSYKRLMKHDIEDPFSPQAIAGAKKIGLNLDAYAKTVPTPSPTVSSHGAGGGTPGVDRPWTAEDVKKLRGN